MSINSEHIRISVKLKNEDYVKLREIGFNRRESHQEIAERAIKTELKKFEKKPAKG